MVSITYDEEVKALHIQWVEGVKTVETRPLGEGKYMDYSEDGTAIGLEIIFPASTPQETIDAITDSKNVVKILTQ